MRLCARGPSGTFTPSMPASFSSRTPSSIFVGLDAARRDDLDRGEELARRELARPTRSAPRAAPAPCAHRRLLRLRDGHPHERAGASMARTAPAIRLMCSGVVPQQPPTKRTPFRISRAGVLRHVLGRRHVHRAAVHLAREAGVRLRRERRVDDGVQAAPRLQHGVRADAAVHPDDVHAPLVEPLGEEHRRRYPSGVWPSSWITICATMGRSVSDSHGPHRLLHLLQVAEGLQDEQVDAALQQPLRLLAEELEAPRRPKSARTARCAARAGRSRPRRTRGRRPPRARSPRRAR